MANWFGGGWMWHSPRPCSSKSWPRPPGSWSRGCSYHSGRRRRKAPWKPPPSGSDGSSAASSWTARPRGCPNATAPGPRPFVAAVVSAAVACTAGPLPRPWRRSPKPASEGRRHGLRPHPWRSTWQSTGPSRGCFRPRRLPKSYWLYLNSIVLFLMTSQTHNHETTRRHSRWKTPLKSPAKVDLSSQENTSRRNDSKRDRGTTKTGGVGFFLMVQECVGDGLSLFYLVVIWRSGRWFWWGFEAQRWGFKLF